MFEHGEELKTIARELGFRKDPGSLFDITTKYLTEQGLTEQIRTTTIGELEHIAYDFFFRHASSVWRVEREILAPTYPHNEKLLKSTLVKWFHALRRHLINSLPSSRNTTTVDQSDSIDQPDAQNQSSYKLRNRKRPRNHGEERSITPKVIRRDTANTSNLPDNAAEHQIGSSPCIAAAGEGKLYNNNTKPSHFNSCQSNSKDLLTLEGESSGSGSSNSRATHVATEVKMDHNQRFYLFESDGERYSFPSSRTEEVLQWFIDYCDKKILKARAVGRRSKSSIELATLPAVASHQMKNFKDMKKTFMEEFSPEIFSE